MQTENSLVLNPFHRLAGWSALLIGLLVMTFAGLLAGHNGTHFPDLITALFTVSTGKFVPVIELLYGWLLLSCWSIFFFAIFRIQKFRLVDLFGTLALSRIPYLFIAILNTAITEFRVPLIQPIVLPLLFVLLGWSFVLTFHALHVSGNLKGSKKWIVFLFTIVFSEMTLLFTISKIYLLIL